MLNKKTEAIGEATEKVAKTEAKFLRAIRSMAILT